MSIEQALIAQAQPYMVETRLRSIVGKEIRKGCMLTNKYCNVSPYINVNILYRLERIPPRYPATLAYHR